MSTENLNYDCTITITGMDEIITLTDEQHLKYIFNNPLTLLAKELGIAPTDRINKGLPGIYVNYGNGVYDYFELMLALVKHVHAEAKNDLQIGNTQTPA